jgi:hypothetical protein
MVLIAPPFAVMSMAVILAERLVHLVARDQPRAETCPDTP